MENNNPSKNKSIDLEIMKKEVDEKRIEVDGRIEINYTGRFDSISINSQIENSSDVFTYYELDDKKINHPYARLSIFKKEVKDPKLIKFKAFTEHTPKDSETNVKFRATLIQEHKEIASDIKFIKIKSLR